MARIIPGEDRRFTQPNNSDLFGNIHYSKNINLDEEGYVKLSPRCVSIISGDDNDDMNIPLAFGREQLSKWFVAVADQPFEIQLQDNANVTASEDTDNGNDAPPQITLDSHATYWQNRWYVTEDALLTYKDPSNGNWTDTAVSLTSGKRHPIEVFRTSASQSLCIGNGNSVKQIDTGHSDITGQQLTIPADFEVVKLAFSGGRMGVATKLSDVVTGQNGEAFFYIWDGLGTSANVAVSAGTDFIVDVIAYKGTYVILTRTGLLRMWNGGGFQDLAQLPVYFTPRVWGDSVNSEALGDVMVVDGDVIYINVSNKTERYGVKGEEYLKPGGIMCYDPKIGLYHRWSPSISPANRLTVTASNVNTSTDVLTKTAGTVPTTGSPIKYIDAPNDQIGGLSIGKVYYCVKTGASTFQLAETREKALAGDVVDLTAQSGSTSYFLAVEFRDYGASYMNRTGAVALADTPNLALDQVVFGGEYQDYDATGNLEHLCFAVREFPNIGYIITPKLLASQVEESWQKGFIKHRRLREGEKITIKAQTEDILGLPVSTPQYDNRCTWKGNNYFSTSADLSEAKTYIDEGGELECEIIAGAGAGQMVEIESIVFSSNTYTVTLKESPIGVQKDYISDVLIENWKTVKTITDTDVEISESPIGETSGWVKLKIIMEGVDVTIYEIPVANEVNKPIA